MTRPYLFLILLISFINANENLYQNGKEITVHIFNNEFNQQTFEIIRTEDNKTLRVSHPSESFFISKGGSKANVNYEIIEKNGGIDIQYTVSNNSDTPQRLPYFQVQGISLNKPNTIFSTNLNKNKNELLKRTIDEKYFKISKRYVGGKFPQSYAPLLMAKDNSFAIGSSLNYITQTQAHMLYMDLYYQDFGAFKNTYRVTFTGMEDLYNLSKKYMLLKNQTFNYVLSLRFSNTKNALYTTEPYNEYLKNLVNKEEELIEENNNSSVYQNNKEINVTIFNDENKRQTFEITRLIDNKKLRISSLKESFFTPKGGSKATISYSIIEKDGGVDINYLVENKTDTPQRLPYFKVEGINLGNPENISSTNLKEKNGRLIKRNTDEKFFSLSKRYIGGKYPSSYSPLLIAQDHSFSVGASLNYPLLKQPHLTYMDLYYQNVGYFANTYRITFTGMEEEKNFSKKYKLAPHKVFKYTLSLRFSNLKNWIETIYPYKEYFNTLYGEDKDIYPRDNRPIYGAVFSSSPSSHAISEGNIRGYYKNRRIDKEGLTPSIEYIISQMKEKGYQRSMLWSLSGCYAEVSKGLKNWSINYPPQFIGDLLPNVEDSLYELEQFNFNNFSLGLWWGHAGSVPNEIQWNPNALVPLQTDNPEHVRFGLNELSIAQEQDVKEIGLDAFGEMLPKEKLIWIKKIKAQAPEIKFTAEGGKTAVDYIHSQVGIFMHPNKVPKGPNTIANYINPNAEIQVYLTDYKPKEEITFQTIQNLVKWGLTPVINEHVAKKINIKTLDLNIDKCYNRSNKECINAQE